MSNASLGMVTFLHVQSNSKQFEIHDFEPKSVCYIPVFVCLPSKCSCLIGRSNKNNMWLKAFAATLTFPKVEYKYTKICKKFSKVSHHGLMLA